MSETRYAIIERCKGVEVRLRTTYATLEEAELVADELSRANRLRVYVAPCYYFVVEQPTPERA